MLIRHLSFFVTLAREGHFAKAAEICHVTQPTLSAAIRNLEQDFGVRLVIRGRQFSGLTPEGDRVLAWARQILADYDSLRDDLGQVRQGLTGTLRLGVVPAAMPVVAFVTDAFHRTHPGASVEILSMSSRQIQSGLDTFELHGGITYLENEPLERVLRLPLYRERYVVIARRDVLPKTASITWPWVLQHALCLLSGDMQNRRILDKIADSHGVRLRPHIVSNSLLAVCSHLRRGGWVSVVPHTLPHLFGLDPALATRPIAGAAETQCLGLVTSDRQPLSLMSSALLAATTEADVPTRIEAAGLTA